MTLSTMLSVGSFILAIPGAVSNSLDAIQKFKKRRAEGKGNTPEKTFSEVHPGIQLAVTLLMVFAIVAGFWFALHPGKPVPAVAANPVPPPTQVQPSQQPVPQKPERAVRPQLKKGNSILKPLPPPTGTSPSAAPAATYQQECKDSACAQGPGAKAEFNQYGPVKPIIEDFAEIVSRMGTESRGHPITTYKFSLSSLPLSQRFYGVCDRPCTESWAVSYPPPNMMSSNDWWPLSWAGKTPKMVGWQINTHMDAHQDFIVSVVSNDDKPVKIIAFNQH